MHQKLVKRSFGAAPRLLPRALLGILFVGCVGSATVGFDAEAAVQDSAFAKSGRTLTLSWQPPVARADGTALPLDEITGYRIGVTAVDESEQTFIRISDPLVTEATLNGLTARRYHFEFIALDSSGQESPAAHLVKSFN